MALGLFDGRPDTEPELLVVACPFFIFIYFFDLNID